LGVGVDDDLSEIPIEDGGFAAGDRGEGASEADDGGDFEGPGEDCGVACFSAGFGCETKHKTGIECGSFAGCEFVSEEDDGLGEIAEFFATFAKELSKESFFEVVDIECAFGEVAVAEVFELFSEASEDATDGGFG
jgi:hypothetical protein